MPDDRVAYPSDLSDAQWELISPLLLAPARTGRPRRVSQREIVNGLLYMGRTGCQWAQVPNDLPAPTTLYTWFTKWQRTGTWERVLTELRRTARVSEGRQPDPTAGSVDAQSAGSAHGGEHLGYDGGKKVTGRKRFLCVDTGGLLIAVAVVAASISDNAGGSRVLDAAMLVAPGLRHLWCDQGFKAGFVADADEDYDVTVTVVNNPDPHRFEIAVRRWVIERTNAWVSAHRRCGKRDLERTVNAAETWITLSQIDVMLNRLAPKPDSPQQRVRDLREADVRDGLKTKHRWGKVG